MLALYLLASALAGQDRKALSAIEVILRLGLAVLILFKAPFVFVPAIVAALVLMFFHHHRANTDQSPKPI